MGLDMYLEDIDGNELGYWRKANAIHQWFNSHVAEKELENCETVKVSRGDLIKLYNSCASATVAYLHNDLNKVAELLPPTSGFFFGSTEIDQFYITMLQETMATVVDVLADNSIEDFTYHAWW